MRTGFCPTRHLQLWAVPLAHPISTTTTPNFGEEMLVVKFMTADPGEAFIDFTHRVENPRPSIWGVRGQRESRNELIFDRSSAERLVGLLNEYLASHDDRTTE